MIRKLFALVAVMFAVPVAAYTVTGTIAPGGGFFYAPVAFDHDGSISFDIRLASASGFGVDSTSTIDYNNVVYYDFYDPQTGESLGGDDNLGQYLSFVMFGNDATGPDAPNHFEFATVFPFAGAHHPYVLQNPGDPYPFETGYTETVFNLYGTVFGNADPVAFAITIDGTAVVPEPASWALMIAGFGATGLVVRRRRRSVPA